mgnify:CR=1 FL=1
MLINLTSYRGSTDTTIRVARNCARHQHRAPEMSLKELRMTRRRDRRRSRICSNYLSIPDSRLCDHQALSKRRVIRAGRLHLRPHAARLNTDTIRTTSQKPLTVTSRGSVRHRRISPPVRSSRGVAGALWPAERTRLLVPSRWNAAGRSHLMLFLSGSCQVTSRRSAGSVPQLFAAFTFRRPETDHLRGCIRVSQAHLDKRS